MKTFINILLITFLAYFCWATYLCCSGTIYWVDYTNGNDSNSGSIGSPFKTMAPVSVTNFLNPGDFVEVVGNNTLTGNDCFFAIKSNGVLGAPITIEGNGSPNPVFNCASSTSSVSGWTGWTNTSGSVWESNVAVPFTVDGVIIDGSYNLLWDKNATSDLSSINYRYLQDGSNFVWVRLPDNTDPNGHTIEFVGQYNPGFKGTVSTGGHFLNIKNLKTYGVPAYGFLSINSFCNFTNDTAIFSGRESFYCATHAQTEGCYNNTFINPDGEYSNGQHNSGAWGQNFTIEGSFNVVINPNIIRGGMAGFDFLGYASDTPASFNFLIGGLIQENSRRSLQSHDGGGFDPQIYQDGGNNNYVIGTKYIGNVTNQFSYAVGGMNATSGIALSSEHPTTNIPHHIYVIGTLGYGCNFYDINVDPGSSHKVIHDVWLIGNTAYGDSNDGGFLISIKDVDSSFSRSIHIWNNAFYQNSSSTPIMADAADVIDSNYNLAFASNGKFLKYGATAETLAQWQAINSQDLNSVSVDPKFITNGSDFHLQRKSLGQANDSPAIGIGKSNPYQGIITVTQIGTTRSDGAYDTLSTPDLGYHYNSSAIPYVSGNSFSNLTLNGVKTQ